MILNYANGLITRNRVIEVCERLFYEKGLEKTTYRDICAAADVRPGTLTHHFNGKNNIAAAIYFKAIRILDLKIMELFPDEDRTQQILTSICINLYVMYQDSCYKRFYIEYSTADIRGGSYTKHLPRILDEAMHEDDNDVEFSMFRAVAYRGMQASLSYYIGERMHEVPFETAYRYWIKLMLSLQEKREKEMEKRIQKALQHLKELEIVWDKLIVHIDRVK